MDPTCNDTAALDLAKEELGLLQSIIQAQGGYGTQLVRWTGAGFAGLSALYLSGDARSISSTAYLFTTYLLLFGMLWMTVIFRVAEDRAIDRFDEVEKFLRGESQTYDGPMISRSISQKNTLRKQAYSLRNVRVFGPFLLFALGSVAVTLIGR